MGCVVFVAHAAFSKVLLEFLGSTDFGRRFIGFRPAVIYFVAVIEAIPNWN